jgi:chromosomal replication initiator protein
MQVATVNSWDSAQARLRSMLSPDIFSLWFAPLRAVEQDDTTLTLEVANDFCEVWLKDNYMGLLQDVVSFASGRPMQVRLRIATAETAAAGENSPAVSANSRGNRTELPHKSPPATPDAGLNPKYTFETFVVGNNNNFSHAAALAVAQAPGKSYNPLFLYGGTGLGKTHLLHAIGQHVLGQKRQFKVSYVTSEKFTNEYIEAIQTNALAKFRRKYRQADVLLIDDIQFLAGKERIQEEFFHTFNALHEAHKQIVLTCDRPASEIQGLEHRLVSRFEWGLVTDLQPPDVEMRLAILRRKARQMSLELPDEIMEFLANRIRTNIRRLEGALLRTASYASLIGRQLSVDSVENLLREILHEEGRLQITIDVIQKRVAEHYDLRIADMTSRRRPENIAFPRQVAMYLSREMTELSLSAIGEAFGGRDHGTVLHACRLVKDRMSVDQNVRQAVHHLEKQLQR